jgi:molecular chaperone DnaK (HSP70)
MEQYTSDTSDTNNDDDHNIINDKYILGIDLGTTNSCIGIWRNNYYEIIPDSNGNKTIPSYVSFTEYNKYVGIEAKNQKEINPENVFYEVKRLIGKKYNDEFVTNWKDLITYDILENDRGMVSLQSTIQNNKIFTPEEISSMILIKLKNMAKKYLKITHNEPLDVIITVPAHFTDSQRQSTKDASIIAGLNCIRFIHEPTAAALAYGILEKSKFKTQNKNNKNNNNDDNNGNDDDDDDDDNDDEMKVLVYDLGGGTLDVSIMEVYDGIFNVVGCAGNSNFGGVDFDNRVMLFCIKKFSMKEYKNKDLDITSISKLSLQRLRKSCEHAKKILSTNVSAKIIVPNFYKNINLNIKIKRSDFENLCRDLFLICMKPINSLLNELNIDIEELDEVILVGGMTHTPYIREMLSRMFSNNKSNIINCSINPDEAVSIGAAIQGHLLCNKEDVFSNSVTFLDVLPLSLGVKVSGGIMDIIIPRNTIMPIEITKKYTTIEDNQEIVLIEAYEGERRLTEHNSKIAEFTLEGIAIHKKGIPEIEITYKVDINGILTIEALETENEVKKTIMMKTNKNGLKQYEIQALIEEAIEQEHIDEIEKIKRSMYYEISELMTNIMTNITSKHCKLSSNDIEIVKKEVNIILKWLKEKNERDTDEYSEMLDKIKKKYGVLILHGKIDDDGVKGISEIVNGTYIRGRDDDEKEKELNNDNYGEIENYEIGITPDMDKQEKEEILRVRVLLDELCENIINIVSSKEMNFKEEDEIEIMKYMEDVDIWVYSLENPTINDYKQKIDDINKFCDSFVDKLETNNDSNSKDDKDSKLYSYRLENTSLALITLIQTGELICSPGKLKLLNKKINTCLEYVYKEKDNDDYENHCKTLFDKLNNYCDTIYESFKQISFHDNMIINTKDNTSDNTNNDTADDINNDTVDDIHNDTVDDINNDTVNDINNDTVDDINNDTVDDINNDTVDDIEKNGKVIIGGKIDINNKNNIVNNLVKDTTETDTNNGMTILELMRIKQNQEMELLINNDDSDDSDDDIMNLI